MKQLYCPISLATNRDYVDLCLQECCAWYANGKCAIALIAEALVKWGGIGNAVRGCNYEGTD